MFVCWSGLEGVPVPFTGFLEVAHGPVSARTSRKGDPHVKRKDHCVAYANAFYMNTDENGVVYCELMYGF